MTDTFKKQREQTIQDLIAKTEAELARVERLPATSRDWTSSRGYRFLVQWSNCVLLRILVRKFTVTLPKSEHRTKTQLDDSARSTVSNIEEGYKRDNTAAYIKFISYTQGSLEEVYGLVNQCLQDGFLKSMPGSSLTDLGIDLKEWNEWAKNPLNSPRLKEFKGKYRKLEEITGRDLTYEIFIELINKTEFLLKKLVVSLELKQQADKAKLV